MNLLNATGMAAGYTMGMDKAGYGARGGGGEGHFHPAEAGRDAEACGRTGAAGGCRPVHRRARASATLVECDYALEKPYCDVLLNGAAYAPGGRPVERIAVGLQVGAWRKSFAVWGNREWRGAGVGYAPSAPEPFDRDADLLRQCVRRHG